jgi:hypothetical protein
MRLHPKSWKSSPNTVETDWASHPENAMARFTYYLADQVPVEHGDAIWRTPLPDNRNGHPRNPSPGGIPAPTYGDYFEAATTFLDNPRGNPIMAAADQLLERPSETQPVARVEIHLVKHGAFYHLARVKTALGSQSLSLALNLAFADIGIKNLDGEFNNLQYLAGALPLSYLPRVFAKSALQTRQGIPCKLFLAEWLDGYHEFHLSRSSRGRAPRVVVWNGQRGGAALSQGQVGSLLAQAATILTCYFNPFTFNQIYPWHHAAGDFVVRLAGDVPQVRLITVRGYQPLFETHGELPTSELALNALLVFALNTTLRMRLDRIDGVGDLVMHETPMVAFIWQGIQAGVQQLVSVHGLPEQFIRLWRDYVRTCTRDDIAELYELLLQRYRDRGDEAVLMGEHLAEHIIAFHEACR